jgi:hypothetical protein
METVPVFSNLEVERIVAELGRQGWKLHLEQVDGGWMAEFRRLRDTVEEVSLCGEAGDLLEAVRSAAAGAQRV